MDTDLLLVVGVIALIMAIPSIISAFSDGRPPRAGAILIMIAGGLIAIALWQKPNTYTFATLPDVFVTVIGRYIY